MRELSRLRIGVAFSFVLASIVALSIVYHVSLLPPGLEARPLEMATASAHVMIDTPQSTVLDVRYGTYDFKALTERGVVLGNVMASAPVREFIARRARIPADAIQASTPLTPEYPRAIAESTNQKHTTDILKLPDQYRISIQANPTVPILDVYAQAPDTKAAVGLADAAVAGLQDYLGGIAESSQVPEIRRIQLRPLGNAQGGVINSGVGLQVALLTFLAVFGLSCAAMLFISRVRRGWVQAARDESEIDLDDPRLRADLDRVSVG